MLKSQLSTSCGSGKEAAREQQRLISSLSNQYNARGGRHRERASRRVQVRARQVFQAKFRSAVKSQLPVCFRWPWEEGLGRCAFAKGQRQRINS